MGDIEFTIHGIKDLLTKLDRLPLKIHMKILRSALKETALELNDAIRAAAPAGEKRSTPHAPLRRRLSVLDSRRSGNTLFVKIVAPFYWRFLEFGTKPRWTWRQFKAYRGRVSPDTHRFLNPVMEREAPKILQKVVDKIAAQISKMNL